MARKIAIWISGIIASFIFGVAVGFYFQFAGDEEPYLIGVGFVAAFTCLRLWLGEKRG